jgi:hypothetical protein
LRGPLADRVDRRHRVRPDDGLPILMAVIF